MSESIINHIRGEVYNKLAFDQKLLFKDMCYKRGITPTDIDFFLEFNSRLFIYGEAKMFPYKLTSGQKSALEHLVDSHNDGGDKSVAIFFQHEIFEPDPVYAKDCFVTEFYLNKKYGWRPPREKITLHDCIKKLISWCEDVKEIEL